MIDKLTPEQESMVPAYTRRYRNIGTNSEVADRTVTSPISRFYDFLKLKTPTFVWVDNPYEAKVVASSLMTQNKKIDKELRGQIENDQTIDRELIERLSVNLNDQSLNYNIGNLNAYWVSFLQYCRKELNVEYDYKDYDEDILDVWEDLIAKCGYFFPFEKVCIVCNRPETHWDENFELHNEEGPSVKFRRGTECDLYCIHGVVVPKEVVMNPESITTEMVRKEENAEVKRIMMEQMGIGKYLEETEAKVIDMDMIRVAKGSENYTPRALMEDSEKRRFLVGSDGSTKRVYHMQVPNTCKTCSEAGDALAGGKSERKIIAHS